MFYSLPKFHCLIPFTSWDIVKFVYCNCLFHICDVIDFEINRSFFIKAFSYMIQKDWTKNFIILRARTALKMK